MTQGPRSPLTGGVICALTTPFDADDQLAVDALDALIERQIAAGIHGLFVAGTSGEGPLMIRKERRLLTEVVVEKVGGRVPVIVHCGTADTRTSEHLARHAEAVGADAVAVVGPYFYSFDTEALFRHFAAVAAAAPSIPHYIYENPERVGYSLGLGLVRRLVTEVENIVGIKDTGDSIGRLVGYLSLIDDPPDVFTGNNTLVYPALSIGAKGAVSALANIAPRLFVRLYEEYRAGRLEEALELQRAAARLQGSLAGFPYVPAIKSVLQGSGVDPGHSRRPHLSLPEADSEELQARLTAAKLTEWLDADRT